MVTLRWMLVQGSESGLCFGIRTPRQLAKKLRRFFEDEAAAISNVKVW